MPISIIDVFVAELDRLLSEGSPDSARIQELARELLEAGVMSAEEAERVTKNFKEMN